MNYYFDDPQRVDELRKTLKEWEGTPFRHACGVKKLGTDCIHMVKAVMEEIGVKGPKIPKYAKDWHMNMTEDILFNGLMSAKVLEMQPDINPRDGDIISFQFGHASSHVAIYCDGSLYHSVSGVGVIKSNFRDQFFKKRIRQVFRVKA